MPNPEHLEILKQGVEVWNKWRDEYPKMQPDLVVLGVRLRPQKSSIYYGSIRVAAFKAASPVKGGPRWEVGSGRTDRQVTEGGRTGG